MNTHLGWELHSGIRCRLERRILHLKRWGALSLSSPDMDAKESWNKVFFFLIISCCLIPSGRTKDTPIDSFYSVIVVVGAKI